MLNKIKLVLSSVRFWQLTIALIIQILVVTGKIDSTTGEGVANLVSVWLVTVAGIGTIDKAAKK